MTKNYMQDVAKMLGVELKEEFMIEDADGYLINTDFYNIIKAGCFRRASDNSKNSGVDNSKLLGILQGRFKIRKLPWQPRKGDKYYHPASNFKDIYYAGWENTIFDIALKEAGMIFRTAEECEAALPELRKKYLEEVFRGR